MRIPPASASLVLVAALLAGLAGCRSDVRVTPPPVQPEIIPPGNNPPAAPSAAVTRLGYTVQVGAFSVLDNARRLAQSLNDLGLDAYFFPHPSGLYRVRFGDYSSRSDAVREAERLLEKGSVPGYFIIGPSDHPVERPAPPGGSLREQLAATAASFVGVDYSWGGASRRAGVDCSGLVRAVYRLNGLNLPRSTAGQFQAGTTVPRAELRKGDLVFFSGSPGRAVSHVGIYVGDAVFIHAPGTGRSVCEGSLDSRYFRDRFLGGRAYLD